MLAKQEPYPALVVDRVWNVLMQNEASGRVFGMFLDREGAAEVPGPPNAVRLISHPRGLRRCIANWEAVGARLIQQIHREAVGDVLDDEIQRLLEEFHAECRARRDVLLRAPRRGP